MVICQKSRPIVKQQTQNARKSAENMASVAERQKTSIDTRAAAYRVESTDQPMRGPPLSASVSTRPRKPIMATRPVCNEYTHNGVSTLKTN